MNFFKLTKDFASAARMVGAELVSAVAHYALPPVDKEDVLAAAPPGNGHTVVSMAGFLSGEWHTRPLDSLILQGGYAARALGDKINLGANNRAYRRAKQKVENLYRHFGPISAVCESVSGHVALELAREMPHIFRGIVLLETPLDLRENDAVAKSVLALHRLINPELNLSDRELTDRILTPPKHVAVTAIHTRKGLVVNPQRARLPVPDISKGDNPRVENVEVPHARHCAMTYDPITGLVVLDALHRFSKPADKWTPFDRAKYSSLLFPEQGASSSGAPENPRWEQDPHNHKPLFKEDGGKSSKTSSIILAGSRFFAA